MFKWGLFLTVVAALVVCGYLYLRLDDEIRRHAEHMLASHYPSFHVHVGKARLEKNRGLTICDLTIGERRSDGATQPILAVDEVFLACDTRIEELMTGKPRIERIVVRRPRVRAVRNVDGQWNVQALFPIPQLSDQSPELQIEDATLMLADATRTDIAPFAVRGIDIKMTPVVTAAGANTRRFQLAGTASGAPAHQLTFAGQIGLADGAVDLTLETRALEVSPELIAAVPARLPAEFNSVQLFGNADATVHLVRPAANAPLDWSANVTFGRGRLACTFWPLPLTELEIKIKADSKRLAIEQLTGKLGMADVTLACNRQGWTPTAPMGLAGKIVGLTIDPQLQSAMPGALNRVWQRFRPAGTADVEVHVTYDGQQWRPEFTAACRGVSFTDTEKFPYPLEQATGTLQLTRSPSGNGMRLQMDLEAAGENQPVRVRADLDQLGSPLAAVAARPAEPGADKLIGWVEVAGNGARIHEQLLAALPDKTQAFVRSLSPEGTIDFKWRYDRTDARQPRGDTSLDLKLSDCAIRFAQFAYPLQQIHGMVRARNGRWELKDLESRDRQGSAVVTCEGTSAPDSAGPHLRLMFRGANIPLDDNLKQALKPQVQRTWEDLRPEGRVDFTAEVQQEAGQEKPEIHVDVRPHEQTVSVEPKCFPYRLEQVAGRALISDGRVDLQQMRARHGNSTVASDGVWQGAPDGGWQLSLTGLSADRLTMDPDFVRALPPCVQKAVERLRPSGSFDLYNSTLNFAKRADAAQTASTWDVQIACHQASLRGDLPLENLSGVLRLLGKCDGPANFSCGELAIDSLIWNDVQLTSIRGPFWTDSTVCLLGKPATDRLSQPARRMTAEVYGGTATADIQIQQGEHPRYQAEIALGAVDMSRIANERLNGPRDLTGTVSGKLSLAGAGRSLYALNGNGELHIVDANIYRLPVLVSLLKVLRNRTPDSTAFDRCDMKFDVRGEHIHFQQLNLMGDAVSLYGRGEANFDRDINLVFYSLVGPGGITVPVLSTVVGQASRQIFQLKVDGNLSDPHITREAFPAVGQMLQQIRAETQGAAPPAPPPESARVPWASPPR